mmetsp:Transcript_45/g.172  ORF Transcript_45/g.172 Transcript_45/m.172 type:complete len:212 (+) Transcript_45:1-636(+)
MTTTFHAAAAAAAAKSSRLRLAASRWPWRSAFAAARRPTSRWRTTKARSTSRSSSASSGRRRTAPAHPSPSASSLPRAAWSAATPSTSHFCRAAMSSHVAAAAWASSAAKSRACSRREISAENSSHCRARNSFVPLSRAYDSFFSTSIQPYPSCWSADWSRNVASLAVLLASRESSISTRPSGLTPLQDTLPKDSTSMLPSGSSSRFEPKK